MTFAQREKDRALSVPACAMVQSTVIIIGAGMTGLGAGYYLGTAGIAYTSLEAKLGGSIRGGMHVKVQAVLHALASGVRAVHVVDGRQPHSVVAELFTDRGVGTLVT